MPTLSNGEQELVKFHLGYTSDAVPYGDQLLLNKVLADNNKTAEWTGYASNLLLRVVRTFEKTELDKQDTGIAYKRSLIGDRNYSDVEERAVPKRERDKAYIQETDHLARYMGVRNYNNPENWQYLNYSQIRQ